MPYHLFAVLRKLHVDCQLLPVPLERTVVVGVQIAWGGTGIVAEHAAQTVRALIPPVKRDEKLFPERSADLLFLHQNVIHRG